MSLCTDFTVVNSNAHEGEAHALKCKRWSCPECAQVNRMKVMHSARKGRPNLFMTLTCDPSLHDSPDDAARDMKRGLVLLRRRIERKWKVKNIPFIVVYEKTKKGWPHMHLLLRAPYMHYKVLRAMWREITGAFEVDVRFIKKATQVLFYVTKYIGKDLHAFEGCKRWWRSHNYNVVQEEMPPVHFFGGGYQKYATPFHLAKWRTLMIVPEFEMLDRHKFRWSWGSAKWAGLPWADRPSELSASRYAEARV